MLFDVHAHTSGISKCCQDSAPGIIKDAKSVGIDGLILTNHYQKSYMDLNNPRDFVKKYIDEYFYTHKCAEKESFKVFYGIEVTMEKYPNVHMLIYGVDYEFLSINPFHFDIDPTHYQKEWIAK